MTISLLYHFWNRFLIPTRNFSASISFLESELNKKRNKELLRGLGITKLPHIISSILGDDADKFIEEIEKKHIATLDKIKSTYHR